MKFVDAKKLRDEDEVIVKKTGCVLHVLGDVEVDGKDVFIPCDDGKLYHHTASNKSVRSRTDVLSARDLVQNADLPGIDRGKKV